MEETLSSLGTCISVAPWQSCRAEDLTGFIRKEAVEQASLPTEGRLGLCTQTMQQRAALGLLQFLFLDRAALGSRLPFLLCTSGG